MSAGVPWILILIRRWGYGHTACRASMNSAFCASWRRKEGQTPASPVESPRLILLLHRLPPGSEDIVKHAPSVVWSGLVWSGDHPDSSVALFSRLHSTHLRVLAGTQRLLYASNDHGYHATRLHEIITSTPKTCAPIRYMREAGYRDTAGRWLATPSQPLREYAPLETSKPPAGGSDGRDAGSGASVLFVRESKLIEVSVSIKTRFCAIGSVCLKLLASKLGGTADSRLGVKRKLAH